MQDYQQICINYLFDISTKINFNNTLTPMVHLSCEELPVYGSERKYAVNCVLIDTLHLPGL